MGLGWDMNRRDGMGFRWDLDGMRMTQDLEYAGGVLLDDVSLTQPVPFATLLGGVESSMSTA